MLLRSASVIVLGLAIAGGSAYLARDMMVASVAGQAAPAAAPAQDMGTVIVALADIGFGQAVTADLIAARDWPADAIPDGAFRTLDAVLGGDGSAPRSTRRAIAAGELLLDARLSDFGEKVTILQSLTPGHRAMTIEVDAVSGVAGFVTPGDRVDIVLTETRSGDLRARTIMQNVRVIGVDQNYGEAEGTTRLARTITVEVTPEDGQRLALAQRAGALSLTLRSGDGTETAPLPALSLSDLLVGDAAEPVAEPAAEPTERRTVTIRRAGETEIIELSN